MGESVVCNHVFVLDMELNTISGVMDIAPGERIYSARFMGGRGYLVTFKKVDPFFVLDLSDPTNPYILGKLKIPGYSNYLHPYDENHVIGIGKDTVPAKNGDFAWYQGVKLSIFDVTDVNNPKELSKYIIGDRGTHSLALDDPHAFLFSMEKNLLVIPILLAEIDESKYPGGYPPNTHGDYTWCGAYVFDISLINGFQLRGGISHTDNFDPGSLSWYYDSPYKVKRSFYIEDVLYTISGNMIKANDLASLSEFNSVELND
jgi:inhibitor of cysteine peptidase